MEWLKNLICTINWFEVVNPLLGVIIGGALAVYGSIIVNKKQYKWEIDLKRVENIYTPLYNNLVENHFDILIDNYYPGYIVFQKGQQTIYKHPQYYEWDCIKLDARYLETPKNVIEIMDNLYVSISKYQSIYYDSCKNVKLFIDNILSEEIGKINTVDNLGDVIINSIHKKDIDEIIDRIFFPKNDTLNKEQTELIANRIMNRLQ